MEGSNPEGRKHMIENNMEERQLRGARVGERSTGETATRRAGNRATHGGERKTSSGGEQPTNKKEQCGVCESGVKHTGVRAT